MGELAQLRGSNPRPTARTWCAAPSALCRFCRSLIYRRFLWAAGKIATIGRSAGIYTARAAKSTLICCKTEPFVISQMRALSFYQEHRTIFCSLWFLALCLPLLQGSRAKITFWKKKNFTENTSNPFNSVHFAYGCSSFKQQRIKRWFSLLLCMSSANQVLVETLEPSIQERGPIGIGLSEWGACAGSGNWNLFPQSANSLSDLAPQY